MPFRGHAVMEGNAMKVREVLTPLAPHGGHEQDADLVSTATISLLFLASATYLVTEPPDHFGIGGAESGQSGGCGRVSCPLIHLREVRDIVGWPETPLKLVCYVSGNGEALRRKGGRWRRASAQLRSVRCPHMVAEARLPALHPGMRAVSPLATCPSPLYVGGALKPSPLWAVPPPATCPSPLYVGGALKPSPLWAVPPPAACPSSLLAPVDRAPHLAASPRL